MKIWIISDTHFNHEKLIELEWLPTNYQEQIIRNWKKLVAPTDTIIHLWDVIIARQSELELILRELSWTKILIKWNHDWNPNNWYLNKWFSLVLDKMEMTIWKKKLIFTHIPIVVWENEYNIHWHLHGNSHHEELEHILIDRHILINWLKPILLNELIW